MAEYIEREALLKNLELLAKYQCGERQQGILGVCETIKRVSTADVVEVVRCCDCRYSDVYGKNCFCEYDPIETKSVSPNGYCSYGERRSEE